VACGGQAARLPQVPHSGAYHTSNWDFIIGLCAAFVLKIRAFWIREGRPLHKPFDRFFRWIGGIPINRKRSQNMVDRIVQIFREQESLVIAMSPEGTRKKVEYWKTGFYHIARGANIPIVLAFIDYCRKACGIGPVIIPTGDLEADMAKIRDYFSGVTGKFPELMTLPAIDPVKFRKVSG
jgi:1-acyl-sn-glycerol-3-phosphate acyltransferase